MCRGVEVLVLIDRLIDRICMKTYQSSHPINLSIYQSINQNMR